jgi:hypothetical protein
MLSDSDIRERLGPLSDPASSSPESRPPSRRRIARLAAFAVLLWIAGLALLVHFERTRPRVPDPSSRRVYRVPGYPSSVYLTVKERYAAGAALAVPVLTTVMVALLAIPRRPPEQ